MVTHLDVLASEVQYTFFPISFEATRWALLVLGSIQPASVKSIPVPQGAPSEAYTQLRASLDVAKTKGQPPVVAGTSAFARLVATIGRGNLTVVK